MKKFRALIFPFAALAFSAIAHAAPVQYQLTAYHTAEISTATGSTVQTPVNPSDYFFADGTAITATFLYDPAVPPIATNVPITVPGTSGPFTALSSIYIAFSNLSFNVAGYSIAAPQWRAIVMNTNGGAGDLFLGVPNGALNSGFSLLAIGNYSPSSASIVLSGDANMLTSQALPPSLTGLSATYTGFTIDFSSASGTRSVRFADGVISQVPLPSSALFFLSGLIGLGANAVRKLKR